MRKASTSFRGLEGMTEAQIKQMINWQDNSGLSPLHVAVRNGVSQHVTKLVALGADCNLPDSEGNTPLHFAAESGSLEILNTVADGTDDLDLQNNLGETPVLLAAHSGSIAAVVSLMSMEKHVVPADTSIKDVGGRNILMHACISGNLDLVRLILANREGKSRKLSLSSISVNEQDYRGLTALMYAAMEGHWHLISILVLLKANLSAKDENGLTALHWAAAQGNAQTVGALIDCGSVIDELNKEGWTALMHAVSSDNVEIAELLIDCGAKLGDNTLVLGKSRRMHEILCDALRDYLVMGKHLKYPPADLVVSGRLTVSIIHAEEVYVDPSAVTDGEGEIVVYAMVEFKSSGALTDSAMVAITEGVGSRRKISWNEPLHFFLRDKKINKESVLCIELFATRNHSPISHILSLRHAAGEDAGAGEEDEHAKRKRMDAMYRGIQVYEVQEMESEAKKMVEKIDYSLHKRKWTELIEARKRLEKYFGIHLPLPPVPHGHFPCGSVRLSYSRLRALFRDTSSLSDSWGSGRLISLTRSPKFSDRGTLSIQLDFVPSPIAVAELREKLDIPKTPKESELTTDFPVDALEEMLEQKEEAIRFATRYEKLAYQADKHYSRWWSSLGPKASRDQKNQKVEKSFLEQEAALVRVVRAIATRFVDKNN